MSQNFEKWFASYLGQEESEIRVLLNNEVATRFLIVWSMFESKCFSGFMQVTKINNYAEQVIGRNEFDIKKFSNALEHFHERYQDKKLYKNLMHEQKSEEMDNILKKDISLLSQKESIFFLLFVVYRYRNNIFHGNKGVDSWLKFEKQITHCVEVMQLFLDIEKELEAFNNSNTNNGI
jgi:hypothetical protein